MTKEELIEKVTELYSDKDGFKEIMKCLKDDCYTACAEKVMTKEFGVNKELAVELYKQDEKKCENNYGFNYYDFIDSILGIYKQDEEKCKNSSDFRALAKSIIKNLNDIEWAIKIYKKAEETCYSGFRAISDFRALAEFIIKNSNDKEWAIKLYKKAEEKGCSFRELAESIIKNLNDKEWAIKLYKKVEKNCKNSYNFRYLAESIIENLNDKEWAIKLYKKAEKECKNSSDFGELTESIIKNLNDKEWGIELYPLSHLPTGPFSLCKD
jgi:hypothetical protein